MQVVHCQECGRVIDNITTGVVVLVKGESRKGTKKQIIACADCAQKLEQHDWVTVAVAKSVVAIPATKVSIQEGFKPRGKK